MGATPCHIPLGHAALASGHKMWFDGPRSRETATQETTVKIWAGKTNSFRFSHDNGVCCTVQQAGGAVIRRAQAFPKPFPLGSTVAMNSKKGIVTKHTWFQNGNMVVNAIRVVWEDGTDTCNRVEHVVLVS